MTGQIVWQNSVFFNNILARAVRPDLKNLHHTFRPYTICLLANIFESFWNGDIMVKKAIYRNRSMIWDPNLPTKKKTECFFPLKTNDCDLHIILLIIYSKPEHISFQIYIFYTWFSLNKFLNWVKRIHNSIYNILLPFFGVCLLYTPKKLKISRESSTKCGRLKTPNIPCYNTDWTYSSSFNLH